MSDEANLPGGSLTSLNHVLLIKNTLLLLKLYIYIYMYIYIYIYIFILFQTNFIITQLAMFYLQLRFNHHWRPSSGTECSVFRSK